MTNNEPFLRCLHALTRGNPISVRMAVFGMSKMFQTDMLVVRAETDLFRILLCRLMLAEELRQIWKMLGAIHNQPDAMKANVQIAAHLLKQAGIVLP